MEYSSEALLKHCLSYVGFDERQQKCSEELNVRRFRAFYGVSPQAVKVLIYDLAKENREVNIASVFMAISWVTLYDIEEVMAAWWGYGEKHCRETVRKYTN